MVIIMMLRQYICVGKLSNEKLLKGQITFFETLSEDIVPMALNLIILDSCFFVNPERESELLEVLDLNSTLIAQENNLLKKHFIFSLLLQNKAASILLVSVMTRNIWLYFNFMADASRITAA